MIGHWLSAWRRRQFRRRYREGFAWAMLEYYLHDRSIDDMHKYVDDRLDGFEIGAKLALEFLGIDPWRSAVDQELVVSLQCTADSYKDPRKALNDLIDWHVKVATDPRVNGGYELVPSREYEGMRCGDCGRRI